MRIDSKPMLFTLLSTLAGGLAAGAERQTFPGNCTTFQVENVNRLRTIPHPCPSGVEISTPTATEWAAGERVTLVFNANMPGVPAARLGFEPPGSGNLGADRLRVASIDGKAANGTCQLMLMPDPMRPIQQNATVICTGARTVQPGEQAGMFAFGLSVFSSNPVPGQKPAAELANAFNAATAAGRPTGANPPVFIRPTTPPVERGVTQIRGGKCTHNEVAVSTSEDITIECETEVRLYVPTVAEIQKSGRRPTLRFFPKDSRLPQVTYVFGEYRPMDGGSNFEVVLYNDKDEIRNASCILDRKAAGTGKVLISCGATHRAPASMVNSSSRLEIAGAPAELDAIAAHFDRAADAAGGKPVAISDHPLAVYGVLPGRPLPKGIGNCNGLRPLSAKVPYCTVPSGDWTTLSMALQGEETVGMGLRSVSLWLNEKIFDTSLVMFGMPSMTVIIDKNDVVQRFRIITTAKNWPQNYDLLKRKYGKPSQELWDEWRNTNTGIVTGRTPVATWRTGGMVVEFTGNSLTPAQRQDLGGSVIITTDALMQLIV